MRAAVLLIAAPILCVPSVRARRLRLAWGSETPEALLHIGISRVEASLKTIRVGRWHVAILALFVATLWTAEALRFIQAIEFLMPYTAICLVASLLAWLWMMWREKRVRSELDACVRLLAMVQASDDEGSDL